LADEIMTALTFFETVEIRRMERPALTQRWSWIQFLDRWLVP
jgi:hypothetical protein